MTHELKILPRWFKDVAQGLKNFEIRKNDRDYKVGDILILKEWDGEHYTGAFVERRIGYVYSGNGEYGVEEGYCILGLYPHNVIKKVRDFLKGEMNIFNDKPRKLICKAKYDTSPYSCPYDLLEIGKVYNVKDVEVSGWCTMITLEEIPDKKFNSVLFKEYEEGE